MAGLNVFAQKAVQSWKATQAGRACRIPKKTAQLSLRILGGLAPFLDIQSLFVFFPRFVQSIGPRAAPGPDVGVVYNK